MNANKGSRAAVTQGHQPRAGKYTAVVYFHGMGEQRRYEEVSRLADALDAYAYWQVRRLNRPLGSLEEIRARLETPRSGEGGYLGYVRVYHHPTGTGRADLQPYRFYEAYWAPVTASERSAKEVFKWMLPQALIPLRTISSP